MFALSLYAVAGSLLLISACKDRSRTQASIRKARKAFGKILPPLLVIVLLIGMCLSVFTPDQISRLLGAESGWRGMLVSSVTGSVTLIPGFVAFPLGAALLEQGAGLMQVAVFLCTLMSVGVVTAPLEARYFGMKATILRNVLAFGFSFLVAWIVALVLQWQA